MTYWQPIRTAPRDGTPILVCQGDYGFNSEHNLNGYPMAVRWTDYGGTGEKAFRNRWGRIERYATHWMPMPKPPVQASALPMGVQGVNSYGQS